MYAQVLTRSSTELPAVAEKVAQSALDIHRAFRKHFGPVKFRAFHAYKGIIYGPQARKLAPPAWRSRAPVICWKPKEN
jgi:hypothetical protein